MPSDRASRSPPKRDVDDRLSHRLQNIFARRPRIAGRRPMKWPPKNAWWNKHQIHVYGVTSIAGTLMAIAFFGLGSHDSNELREEVQSLTSRVQALLRQHGQSGERLAVAASRLETAVERFGAQQPSDEDRRVIRISKHLLSQMDFRGVASVGRLAH